MSFYAIMNISLLKAGDNMEKSYYTNRLCLRVLSAEDSLMVLRFHENNIRYFEPYEPVKPDNFYTDIFQYNTLLAEESFFDDNYFFRYYVFCGSYTDPIGTVSFKKSASERPAAMTLGYKFDKRFWGNGFAYESISFLTDQLFKTLDIQNLEAIVQPDNYRSINLLTKLGFVPAGDAPVNIELSTGRINHHIYLLRPIHQ